MTGIEANDLPWQRLVPFRRFGQELRHRVLFVQQQEIADQARNRLICDKVLQSVEEGRSPLELTERKEHLDALTERLSKSVKHPVVLRGGMGEKAIGETSAKLAAIPEHEPRVLVATGHYIAAGSGSAVPRSSYSTARCHFDIRHEFRHAGKLIFN